MLLLAVADGSVPSLDACRPPAAAPRPPPAGDAPIDTMGEACTCTSASPALTGAGLLVRKEPCFSSAAAWLLLLLLLLLLLRRMRDPPLVPLPNRCLSAGPGSEGGPSIAVRPLPPRAAAAAGPCDEELSAPRFASVAAVAAVPAPAPPLSLLLLLLAVPLEEEGIASDCEPRLSLPPPAGPISSTESAADSALPLLAVRVSGFLPPSGALLGLPKLPSACLRHKMPPISSGEIRLWRAGEMAPPADLGREAAARRALRWALLAPAPLPLPACEPSNRSSQPSAGLSAL